MILSRRGILRCLTGLIAAPAIVRADALMRVVAPKPYPVLDDWLTLQSELEYRLGALRSFRASWFEKWDEVAQAYKRDDSFALKTAKGIWREMIVVGEPPPPRLTLTGLLPEQRAQG